MNAQENQLALPLRSHTILGVCEAIGEDFGFNPVFLRVPLAAIVLWNPLIAIGAYLALGAVVLASRLLFPKAKAAEVASKQEVPVAANEQRDWRRPPNRGLELSASLGARFEQIEKRAVLKEQLLSAERQRAGARRRLGAEVDDAEDRSLIGKRRRRRLGPCPGRCTVEEATDRPPIPD